MARPRDTQRSKLYAAENGHSLHSRLRLEKVEDCQAFIDSVMASRWVSTRWRRSVVVKPGFGHRSATGSASSGVIQAPVFARTKLILLHELTHVLLMTHFAAHGPEFAGLFIALVEHVLGREAASELRSVFKAKRVRWNNDGIEPAGYAYVSKSTVVAKRRERASRPPSASELQGAADVIRRAAKAGMLGGASLKPRVHALATARLLERADTSALAARYQNS